MLVGFLVDVPANQFRDLGQVPKGVGDVSSKGAFSQTQAA